MLKEFMVAICVFGIFLNLALLGFSWANEDNATSILALCNIVLLSFVFVPKK